MLDLAPPGSRRSLLSLLSHRNVYGGWGDDLWEQGYLEKAIAAGMSSEAEVDTALSQVMMLHVRQAVVCDTTLPHALLARR